MCHANFNRFPLVGATVLIPTIDFVTLSWPLPSHIPVSSLPQESDVIITAGVRGGTGGPECRAAPQGGCAPRGAGPGVDRPPARRAPWTVDQSYS